MNKETYPVQMHFPPKAQSPKQKSAWTSSNIVIRALAVIGLLFLIQKTATYYIWSQHDRISSLSGFTNHTNHVHVGNVSSHPIDSALDHQTANTGHTDEFGQKAIVVASLKKENTSWIHENFPDWQLNIYVVDDAKADMTILKQGGHEAAVFLTYIIQHYYSLPSYMTFLHAQRYQWHNDDPMFDGVNPVKNLRLPYVKQEGYVNLRCTQHPGCPVGVKPDLKHNDGIFDMHGTYARVFKDFFPERKLPKMVAAPCCAQFAVTKEQVQLRPVQDYERLRQWIWSTNIDAQVSGRVMEYMWHILFNKEDVVCVDAKTCFCQKFGLCDLDCPNPKMCNGRWYELPFMTTIPNGWPQEGQTGKLKPYGWWQEWYPQETFGLEWMNFKKWRANVLPAVEAGAATVEDEVTEKKEEIVDEAQVDLEDTMDALYDVPATVEDGLAGLDLSGLESLDEPNGLDGLDGLGGLDGLDGLDGEESAVAELTVFDDSSVMEEDSVPTEVGTTDDSLREKGSYEQAEEAIEENEIIEGEDGETVAEEDGEVEGNMWT